MKKIIIYNPVYGTKHCGPLDSTEMKDLKDIIIKIKQFQKEKPHIYNNRTIIQGIRDGSSEDKTYKIGLYNFSISKGRMELQYILKRFPPETDLTKVVDKWGDLMGYLFWKGKICDYEYSIWVEPPKQEEPIDSNTTAETTINSSAETTNTVETDQTPANKVI